MSLRSRAICYNNTSITTEQWFSTGVPPIQFRGSARNTVLLRSTVYFNSSEQTCEQGLLEQMEYIHGLRSTKKVENYCYTGNPIGLALITKKWGCVHTSWSRGRAQRTPRAPTLGVEGGARIALHTEFLPFLLSSEGAFSGISDSLLQENFSGGKSPDLQSTIESLGD